MVIATATADESARLVKRALWAVAADLTELGALVPLIIDAMADGVLVVVDGVVVVLLAVLNGVLVVLLVVLDGVLVVLVLVLNGVLVVGVAVVVVVLESEVVVPPPTLAALQSVRSTWNVTLGFVPSARQFGIALVTFSNVARQASFGHSENVPSRQFLSERISPESDRIFLASASLQNETADADLNEQSASDAIVITSDASFILVTGRRYRRVDWSTQSEVN